MKKLRLSFYVFFMLLVLRVTSVVAQNDLNQKLMMGYQGWFLCRGDNAAPNEWRHWFQSLTDPSVSQLNVDMWPEMSEYTSTYATNMSYPNGTNARLFSSHDASTTNLHFKWMRDYNIYGVYLQRFLGEIGDQRFFQVRNNVLQNVINASSTYGRHFSIMYDLSGVPDDGNLYNKLITDWEYLVNTYNVTNRAGYVKQNGLPVLAIWGIGFRERGLKPETFQQIINYFHNTAAPQYRAYIVGGVPDSWRTLNNDSESDPRWLDVYRSLDMISPWAVGRYKTLTEADNWKTNKIIPDMNDCAANGVDYMPVIFPGFSWYNMHDGLRPLNEIPRAGGNFYWRQAYNAISTGADFVYVAMFDEVDEGTAMFKLAATNANAPANAGFVTLDEDGQSLPSDWYLRLANETQKMLDGSAPLSSTIPISPNNNVPVISSSGTATGTVNASFTYSITASNNPTSYGASALPAGLSVNTTTGVISGTPTTTGTFNSTVTATNASGTGSKTVVITINPSTPVTGMPGNPFIRHMYTADPSARVWADGRLYVYPSHDIAPPRGADLMDQYHVFSTDDMVNWVDHGEILRASDVPWGRSEGGFMWAPDCAYKNGTYYFYFPHPSGTEWNSTWKIGVATSSSPASGFTVQGYIPGLESLIDPCVFIDDDGQAYFYYGGGGVCKGGKLKTNMMEIDGQMQIMQGLVDFHEASWVHKRNGIYYLSYSDNHDVGDSHNQMRYATSTSPLGPWTHRGIYMDPTDSYTNHGSIVEYKGQWYSFYHNSALSGNDWLRSICVDKLFYNGDGTIQKVIQTKGHGTPYGGTAWAVPGVIQAENFDIGGPAYAYSDHDSINSGGQHRPNEGVDIEVCGEGGFNVGWINSGEWLEYTVNVASAGSYMLNLRVATETTPSAIQVEFDGIDKTGVMTVPATGGWQTYTTISKSVTLAAGKQYMRVWMRGGAFNFNSISITGNTQAPVISSSGTASGTVNTAFNYTITASNSPTSYGASGLPPGVSVNTSTGVINGTPTSSGTFNATVTATNASGTGSKALVVTINSSLSQSIPGTIQSENYCAMSGIQLENTADTGGGQNVGWIDPGDWLDFCVTVSATGTYNVSSRIASPNTGGQFQFRLGSNILSTVNVPNTGGWQTWSTMNSTINLNAGTQTIRLHVVAGGFNINWIQFASSVAPPVISSSGTASGTVNSPFNYTITASNNPTSYGASGLPSGLSVNTSTGVISGTPGTAGTFNATITASNAGGTGSKALTITVNTAGQSPYPNGTPWAVPGTIEVENFDTGGEGIAYHDNDALNSGGQGRTSEGVDTETCSEGGLNIGWTNTGEWLEYTVNVASAGTYDIDVRTASIFSGGSFHIEFNGVDKTGPMTTTNSGAWQTWTTISKTGVTLSAGVQVMRIYFDNANFNINKVTISSGPVGDPPGTITCYRSPGAITVNGSLSESGWNVSRVFSKAVVGSPNNNATFGVLWDNANLYIGAKVLDGNLFSDSSDPWADDAVEIYIDANNNKLTSYDNRDNQIIKNYNKSTVFTKFAISGLQHAWATITGGYSVEVAIPWSQLGITAPAHGTTLGFDIAHDDDDNGGVREHQAVWHGTINNYQNTSAFGSLVLNSTQSAGAGGHTGTDHASVETVSVFIAPNPVKQGTTKVIIPSNQGEVHVQVFDLNGKRILQSSFQGIEQILDLSRHPAGLYILKVIINNKMVVKKVMIE
jgi:arabinoxylan arabinofuranohydrolase